MELERMHHQSQATNGGPRARRAAPHSSSGMEHLNLSIPLHVQVPPLPSPNTTAAAAALFRVNQLPPAASTPDAHAANGSAFSFKSPSAVSLKRRQRLLDDHGHALGIYAPVGTPTAPSQPTPTTAAAAAAAMALSASSPASAASVEQYEQNKRAMMLAAANAKNEAATTAATSATPSTGTNTVNDGPEMRRRKVGIPKFLRYLFQMLEYEDHAVIAWSHDGAAFQIRDPDGLAERVLPKYFKHNKVSSFQRQLNYFGFKKWTKTQTNICTFSHPCFHRDEQEKMRLIKRKERSTRNANKLTAPLPAGGPNRVTTHDDDEMGHDDDDDDDGSDAPHPPAKRAKLSKQSPPSKRPPTASPSASGQPTPPRGRGRPPSSDKVKKESKPKATKPPRGGGAKKSPRSLQQPDREPPSERPSTASTNARKQLPTISPASAASSALSSSTSVATASLGRLVPHSASPSPTHQAMYSGRLTPSGDAAPVLPVHSELLLQQQQSNNSFLRRFNSSPYDNGPPAPLQDLSEAFTGAGGGSGGGWSSQQQQQQQSDAYGLGAYKFPDPTDFGYGGGPNPSGGGGSGPSGGAPAGPGGGPNAKDYLDVLLESANMDDPQLSAQSAAAPWDASYHNGYAPSGRGDPTDRRMAEEAAMATFNMLNVPPHQHQQLPSIEDLQGTGRY